MLLNILQCTGQPPQKKNYLPQISIISWFKSLIKYLVKWNRKAEKRHHTKCPTLSLAQFSSVAQSCLTLCDPRLPCPSPTPGAYSNSCLSNQWCHPTISSSVIPFSFDLSYPASGSFLVSQFFASSGPKYWSFSFSISPFNEYSGLISFRVGWFDLLAAQGILKSSLTPYFKSTNSSALSFHYSPTLTSIYNYWKNHSFD